MFLKLIQTENKKYWIWLGIVLGFGLLNKTSVLWLGAGILVGTIVTPLRKDLYTKYPYIAFVIALLIFSPYIIWNITSHDFAHLEFMRNAAIEKYGGLTPISFIMDQLLIHNPVTILIWLPGIIFYFFKKDSRQFRPLGFIWLTTFLILLINGHSKGEYISAAYQILFAGGSVLVERWSELSKRSWLKYAITLQIIVFGILLSPLARPLLSPESFIQYQSALGLEPPSNEGHELVGLPQFFSDMFGWEDLFLPKMCPRFISLCLSQKEKIPLFTVLITARQAQLNTIVKNILCQKLSVLIIVTGTGGRILIVLPHLLLSAEKL